MSEAIKGLKPKKLWRLFAQISSIPHGSKNEAALMILAICAFPYLQQQDMKRYPQ